MYKIDWDNVQEADGFDNPKSGAYIAEICRVEDLEEKEYLLIEWDFAEGQYKGDNQRTFERAGFWPIQLRRSYKQKALGFFKAFKTALEESTPGYHFNELDLRPMVGKRFGVVLGEEEYQKNDGTIGKRLYVAQCRSIQAIQKGDFTIPDLKQLQSQKPTPQSFGAASGLYQPPFQTGQNDVGWSQFSDFEEDGKLPFK